MESDYRMTLRVLPVELTKHHRSEFAEEKDPATTPDSAK